MPMQPSGLSQIISVIMGCDSSHTLALKSDHSLWAWGLNTRGQLGTGRSNAEYTHSSFAPQQVSGLMDVISAAAGQSHSLAARGDGTVWAWGSNDYGQLGNTSSNFYNSVPVQVAGLTGVVVAVAAGDSHSLALKNDGTVWTWGINTYGQLGNNSTTNSNVPVQVVGLTGIIAIAGGNLHSLALKSDGTVWAWGYNSSGQLGNGTWSQSLVPVQVVEVISGSNVSINNIVAISAGAYHSLALKNDGTVRAWGSNAYGQLGNNAATYSNTAVQPTGLSNVVSIAAGAKHSLVVQTDGTVLGSGYNGENELGNTPVSPNYSTVFKVINGVNLLGAAPANVQVLGGPAIPASQGTVTLQAGITANKGAVVKTEFFNGTTLLGTATSSPFTYDWSNVPPGNYLISVRTTTAKGMTSTSPMSLVKVMRSGLYDSLTSGPAFNTVLKTDGTVWSWGSNESGELGNGLTLESHAPVWAAGLNSVVAVQAGQTHVLTLKSDGTAWSWGDNSQGQLGNNSTTNSSVPVQVVIDSMGTPLTGIVAVSAGYNYSLALKNDGTVWAWGVNGVGQLGNSSTTNSNVPVQVTGLTGAVAVAAGAFTSGALKNDGTVWTWGGGGALGNNSSTNSLVPVQASSLTGVVSLAAGAYHFVALKNDQTVWGWGNNVSSQLGSGAGSSSLIPVQISGLTSITAIAAGFYDTLGLKSDGTIWICGNDGDGPGTQFNTPTQLSGIGSVVALAPGSQASTYIALDKFGTMWVWGDDIYGELGDGGALGSSTYNGSNVPLPIVGFNGTIATAEGATHTLALHADGTVWAWGDNSSGQLGVNSTTSSPAPVQVSGINDAVAVTAGSGFSLALQADGSVWAWGNNSAGQLGDGSTVNRLVPVPAKGVAGVMAVAAGTDFAYALASDGTVWAWGADGHGQLGDNSTTGTSTPAKIANLSGIVQIAAGNAHGLALDASQNVWTWGANGSGQLGNTTTTDSGIPAQLASFTAQMVAAGGSHSLAIQDGGVLAWGLNSSGQLGDGTTTNRLSPVWVSALPSGTNVIDIGGGQTHSTALDQTGTIYTWGDNSTGQLGNGGTTNSSAATAMSGLPVVLGISTGSQASHTFTLEANGSLWGWGLNTSGQLEDGTSTTQLSPVQALGTGVSGATLSFTLVEPAGAVLLP
jgi:alpha-tubulin suppressor-like RCC1 family protein